MKGFIFIPEEYYEYYDERSEDSLSSLLKEHGIFISSIRISLDFINISYDKKSMTISEETEKRISDWVDNEPSVFIILYPIRHYARKLTQGYRALNRLILTISEERIGSLECMKDKSPIIFVYDSTEVLLA